MINQFQRHIVTTFRTKQGVFTEAVEETLLKRFCRQHSVTSGVGGHISGNDLFNEFSHFLISGISMQAVIANSLKALWQDVLYHSSNELQDAESFVFNLSCFMVSVPIADGFTVVFLNSANRNGRRYDVLCQILRQPLSAWRHLSGLKESYKTLGIISPCSIYVFFNGGIGDVFSDHFKKMILPFSMHHIVGDVRNRFPLAVFINSPCGHEDMKVWVVMAGTSCSLKHNDGTDVECYAGAGIENILEAGITCSHEGAKQCGIAVEPSAQKIRHSQHDMSISYSGQQPPADEVGPPIGVNLGAGKAEAGFAGECDASGLSTVATSVLNKAHFIWVAAIKHLLDGLVIVRVVKAWMQLFKLIPVIVKNLFESVFINAFHGCSLRTTITEMAQ